MAIGVDVMSFGYPLILMLLVIPAAIFYWEQRSTARWEAPLKRFGTLPQVKTLFNFNPKTGVHQRQLFYAGLAFLILALGRPQWGQKEETVNRRGLEILFAVDVSHSMKSEDIPPSRIEKSVTEIIQLVDGLGAHRTGLITFAGSASPIVPMTNDLGAFKLFLKTIKYHDESVGGTNLEAPFRLAQKMFSQGSNSDKALIIFTDGEGHDGNINDIIDEARSQRIHIYPVGVGTQAGQPIPLWVNGQPSGYLKDKKGTVVISHIDIEGLKQLATEGQVFLINEKGGSALGVFQELQRLKKGSFQTRRVSSKIDRYPWFVALALLCFFTEMTLTQSTRIVFLGKRILIFLLCCGLTAAALRGAPLHANPLADLRNLRGNHFYKKGNADRAFKYYSRLPDENAKTHLNRGIALEQSKLHPQASSEFGAALNRLRKNDPLRHDAYHNLGNSLMGEKKYADAVQAYQQALIQNHSDADTKHNLEMALKLIGKQEQPQQQQQSPAKKSQSQDDQKKQNAKSVLDSFRDEEQKTLQDKMRRRSAKPKPVEKDW